MNKLGPWEIFICPLLEFERIIFRKTYCDQRVCFGTLSSDMGLVDPGASLLVAIAGKECVGIMRTTIPSLPTKDIDATHASSWRNRALVLC